MSCQYILTTSKIWVVLHLVLLLWSAMLYHGALSFLYFVIASCRHLTGSLIAWATSMALTLLGWWGVEVTYYSTVVRVQSVQGCFKVVFSFVNIEMRSGRSSWEGGCPNISKRLTDVLGRFILEWHPFYQEDSTSVATSVWSPWSLFSQRSKAVMVDSAS